MTIWLNYWTNGLRRSFVLQVSSWILGGHGHSWWTWRWCQRGKTSIGSVCESFINVWHWDPCQDSTCPPSLFLESRRTWTFLIDLEMVSDGREHPSELSVKVSSRSDIRNHVKTPPVLQVTSRSLGGHGHSWWTWKWCQIGGNIHLKCLSKFHQDLTSGTMSRLHLSSKSLPGI